MRPDNTASSAGGVSCHFGCSGGAHRARKPERSAVLQDPTGFESGRKDICLAMNVLEYVLFGVLVLANLSLGLWFSLRKKHGRRTGSTSAAVEVFLGSRTLMMLPLAASTVASTLSSTGLVALPVHYYAYGWHVLWAAATPLLLFPLATRVFVPVIYDLGVTSIFQYIRMRFNSTISFTACAIYIFLTQSVGAISIIAASLALETVFHAPVLWCNIAIGLSGTVYTALGGLRGVVWTDCAQFLIIVCAPVTVIAKVIIDSMSPGATIRPLNDLDIRKYIAEYSLDFTSEENIWSYFFGAVAPTMCRLCFDQVVAQRLLASRTLKDAQRNAITSSTLFSLVYVIIFSMGMALTIWFRGCDPVSQGAVNRIDQIVPYYITTRLVQVPGLVGIFLAGVVCAATSTTSSTINSQAAILYVDVIAPRWKDSTRHVLLITRCTALGLGITMTVYSMLCAYMGSLSRVFLMMYTSLTSPYVGLCLLAVLFPFVHSKGAGVGTIVTVIFQLWYITNTIQKGTTPPRMPISLDYCPTNVTLHTSTSKAFNISRSFDAPRSQESFFLLRMSYHWSSFFGVFATIAIGVLVSALTGEMWNKKEQPELCSDLLVKIWRKPTHLRDGSQLEEKSTLKIDEHNANAEALDLLTVKTESHV
ncbi:sodium-coupled monocarboxylate transporter 1-like isoform X2 [Dermacentor albipictus]|uniref:sodium-coupled monocarboxylate transporter 1-like isoform X2 n=1 Tax=Dermacentor albipictus TaxID=60249 RepID=UPI0038FD2E99